MMFEINGVNKMWACLFVCLFVCLLAFLLFSFIFVEHRVAIDISYNREKYSI